MPTSWTLWSAGDTKFTGKVLDTRFQGAPQSRPRFYLLALLRPVADRRLAFPAELPTPDLLRFLDPPGAEAAAPFSVWSSSKHQHLGSL